MNYIRIVIGNESFIFDTSRHRIKSITKAFHDGCKEIGVDLRRVKYGFIDNNDLAILRAKGFYRILSSEQNPSFYCAKPGTTPIDADELSYMVIFAIATGNRDIYLRQIEVPLLDENLGFGFPP